MSQNVAITASTDASPNHPKPSATPAPAAGTSENSVTMLGVMRRAARKSISGSRTQYTISIVRLLRNTLPPSASLRAWRRRPTSALRSRYTPSSPKKNRMLAMAIVRSAKGRVLPDDAVADVVTRQRRQAGQRQLAAAVARRRVRGRDQLHAVERLLRLAADELLAVDGPLEVVEQ